LLLFLFSTVVMPRRFIQPGGEQYYLFWLLHIFITEHLGKPECQTPSCRISHQTDFPVTFMDQPVVDFHHPGICRSVRIPRSFGIDWNKKFCPRLLHKPVEKPPVEQ